MPCTPSCHFQIVMKACSSTCCAACAHHPHWRCSYISCLRCSLQKPWPKRFWSNPGNGLWVRAPCCSSSSFGRHRSCVGLLYTSQALCSRRPCSVPDSTRLTYTVWVQRRIPRVEKTKVSHYIEFNQQK